MVSKFGKECSDLKLLERHSRALDGGERWRHVKGFQQIRKHENCLISISERTECVPLAPC